MPALKSGFAFKIMPSSTNLAIIKCLKMAANVFLPTQRHLLTGSAL